MWAHHPHELLELAKALGYARPAPRPGTVVVTCSGGDAAIAADVAHRLGVPLPALAAPTVAARARVLPANATVANPLDYTAVMFGAVQPTADLVACAGADPAAGSVLVYYDRPADLDPPAAADWDDALTGVMEGAKRSSTPVLVASTLPELMPSRWPNCSSTPAWYRSRVYARACAAPGSCFTRRPTRPGCARSPRPPRGRGPGRGDPAAGWIAEHEPRTCCAPPASAPHPVTSPPTPTPPSRPPGAWAARSP